MRPAPQLSIAFTVLAGLSVTLLEADGQDGRGEHAMSGAQRYIKGRMEALITGVPPAVAGAARAAPSHAGGRQDAPAGGDQAPPRQLR